MKIESQSAIDVAKIVSTIISSRDLVNNLKQTVDKTNKKNIRLDLNDIEFVSRSAAHALLLMKEDLKRTLPQKKEVVFINANKDVEKMLRTVAANLALPKKNKPRFKAERININSLSSEPLDNLCCSCHK